MSQSPKSAEEWYKPGDKAPCSGVYIVRHDGHRAEHEATLLEGDFFPICSICGQNVAFRVAHTAKATRGEGNFKTE